MFQIKNFNHLKLFFVYYIIIHYEKKLMIMILFQYIVRIYRFF